MATDREIIKEFLVSLGYHVDEISVRKFSNSLFQMSKTAAQLGGVIASVGTAAEAMVHSLATQMERFYYMSQRTGQTITNLRALEFAAGQIGLTADQVTGALENMSFVLATKPWMKGLLARMGIDPNSKNLLTDFVRQMSKLPFMMAAQYGEMFGIDAHTLRQLIMFLPEFLKAQDKSKNMDLLAGFDEEKLKKLSADGREFDNQLKEIWKTVGMLKDQLASNLLPVFTEFNGAVKQFTLDLMDTEHDMLHMQPVINTFKALWWGTGEAIQAVSDAFQEVEKYLLKGGSMGGALGVFTKSILGHAAKSDAARGVDELYGNNGGRSASGRITGPGQQGAIAPQTSRFAQEATLANLETMFGLPPGILGRMWKQESGRGKHMLSPKGAQGHFGFMPDTARDYGVTDPNNFQQSAAGAAAYLGNLLRMYEGNLAKALAAYNWGPGNVDKKGLGAAPSETRKYLRDVGGITINSTINVHGATDPVTTAKEVGAEVKRTYGDALRIHSGVIH